MSLDLIGAKVGVLTVEKELPARIDLGGRTIRWFSCRCSCGNTLELSYIMILRGAPTSCGCQKSPIKPFDLTGLRAGGFKIIGKESDKPERWICQCISCGRYKTIKRIVLTDSDKTPNCICSLIGKKINMLTVLGESEDHMLRCRCDCGKEVFYKDYVLRSKGKAPISCGHIKNSKDIVLRSKENAPISCGHIENSLFPESASASSTSISTSSTTSIKKTEKAEKTEKTEKAEKKKKKADKCPNLVGNRYGRLKVMALDEPHASFRMWRCHCDCGDEITIREGNLLSGNTRSCGCLAGLKGEVFGNLTVITPVKVAKRAKPKVPRGAEGAKEVKHYICRCICGNEITASFDDLYWGTKTDCGCITNSKRWIDLTGYIFGNLTVLRSTSKTDEKRKRYWLCRCKCAREFLVKHDDLLGKRVTSCGCSSAASAPLTAPTAPAAPAAPAAPTAPTASAPLTAPSALTASAPSPFIKIRAI